jgi:hypothetical protein
MMMIIIIIIIFHLVRFDGVRLCLQTVVTNGPIVHLPGDEYGEPRWNYIDRGKPKNSEKILLQCHFVHHKIHMD